MTTKAFEIRDRATFIPAIAVRLDPADERERYLIARCGFGVTPSAQAQWIMLLKPLSDEAEWMPHRWSTNTMRTAHAYIFEHFAKLPSGAVIDCEFIRGETSMPVLSEEKT
jgi:hypothetical protein